MKTIIVLSVLLLSVIAVGTTTTTIQIQPAYSQATHCTLPFAFRDCATPGQNPSTTSCFRLDCDTTSTTQQEAGQTIGDIHQACSVPPVQRPGCVVFPPE